MYSLRKKFANLRSTLKSKFSKKNLTKVNSTNVGFFMFEKLSSINVDFWLKLCTSQNANMGIYGFKDSLLIAKNNNYDSIYISYISNIPKRTIQSIEILMTVFVNNASYITTHMGIFTNKLYTGLKHSRLSIPLHEFSATESKKINNNIRFMVTKPVEKMVGIMKEAFKDTKYVFWYGSMNERFEKIKIKDEMKELYKELYVRFEGYITNDNKITSADRKRITNSNNYNNYNNTKFKTMNNNSIKKRINSIMEEYNPNRITYIDDIFVPPSLYAYPPLDDTADNVWKIENISFNCPYWITSHPSLSQSNNKYSIISINYLCTEWNTYKKRV